MAGCKLTLMLNHDHHRILRQVRPLLTLRPDDSRSQLEIPVLAVRLRLRLEPRKCFHRYQASRLLLPVVMPDLHEIVISHPAGPGRHMFRHRPKIRPSDMVNEAHPEPTKPTLATVSAPATCHALATKDGERLGWMLRWQPRSKN